MRHTKHVSKARFWQAAAAALLVPAGAYAAEGSGRIDVTVGGLRSADGAVAIALFDQAAQFDARTGAIRKAYLTIRDREAHWVVEGLPPGEYALLAYHDSNGNAALDFRPLGIPKEPVAVSNGATRLLGPPRFESAKFVVGASPVRLELELR